MSLSFLPEDMNWTCRPCGTRLKPGRAADRRVELTWDQ